MEGNELATSIGASFITIPLDASCSQTTELAGFFGRVRAMVPKTSTIEQSIRKNSSPSTTLDKHSGCPPEDSSSTVDMHVSNHSTGTLLSQSSTSGESSLSSAPTSRNPVTAMNFGYSSAALRPRLRMAQVISPHSLPIPLDPPVVAPLATPEAIDVATEYSVVQDALVDDKHIYETIDFCTTTTERRPEKVNMSRTSEREKKCPLSTAPSSSSSTTISQASSAGSSISTHRDDIAEVKRLTPSKSPFYELHLRQRPPADTQPTKCARIKPRIAPKPTTASNIPRMICSMPSRSITMDVINHESVVKARQIYAQRAVNVPVLRQSISVESLADLMCEKKKRFRFVRKVATSFRFKKPMDKEGAAEKSIQSPPIGSSRSLPQSPQVEHKSKKPISVVSSEKTSNAFSWLPSRSPKRGHKAVHEGVVGANDTLQSLAEKNNGLPLFLMRCIEFIEKGGGLEMEGLYRVPGNQAQLSELEKAFRDKGDVDIASLDVPVHVVATAVKNFFSCLSEPLIPTDLHKDILDCLNGSEVVERLQAIMDRLTPVNRKVLVYFISHLHRVASSPRTAMDIHNLSKVLFPTLFRPQFHNFVEMSTGTAKFQQATEVILKNAFEIFQTHQAQSIRV